MGQISGKLTLVLPKNMIINENIWKPNVAISTITISTRWQLKLCHGVLEGNKAYSNVISFVEDKIHLNQNLTINHPQKKVLKI